MRYLNEDRYNCQVIALLFLYSCKQNWARGKHQVQLKRVGIALTTWNVYMPKMASIK